MQINTDEQAIVTALRSNPQLKECVLEMIDMTNGEAFEELNDKDDAEEAVVAVTQKASNALLSEWIEKKKTQAEEEMKEDKNYRPHKKKDGYGKHL